MILPFLTVKDLVGKWLDCEMKNEGNENVDTVKSQETGKDSIKLVPHFGVGWGYRV